MTGTVSRVSWSLRVSAFVVYLSVYTIANRIARISGNPYQNCVTVFETAYLKLCSCNRHNDVFTGIHAATLHVKLVSRIKKQRSLCITK